MAVSEGKGKSAADISAQLSKTENFFLGFVSGVSCKVVNYPLLNVKNHVCMGEPVPTNPKLLYRGLPAACMNLGGTTAAAFAGTAMGQTLFRDAGFDRTTTVIGGSFIGGIVSGVPCSMMELTMIQQARFGGSIPMTVKRVLRDLGPFTYTRGSSVTMAREAFYNSAMLGVTPEIQKAVLDANLFSNDSVALAIGSLLGGTLSCIATQPLDTIKACLQGDLERKKYTTIPATAAQVMHESGTLGIFRGIGWRIGLVATTFFLVNSFKSVYAPYFLQLRSQSDSRRAS